MKLKQKIKLWRVKTYIIAKEFFHYSLITYLLTLIAEIVKEGIVSYFFNTNIILIIVLVSGFVMTITYAADVPITQAHKKKLRWDTGYSILLAIVGGFFVYGGIFDLGAIAIVVGCLAAVLILLVSLLLLSAE